MGEGKNTDRLIWYYNSERNFLPLPRMLCRIQKKPFQHKQACKTSLRVSPSLYS